MIHVRNDGKGKTQSIEATLAAPGYETGFEGFVLRGYGANEAEALQALFAESQRAMEVMVALHEEVKAKLISEPTQWGHD